MSPDSPVVTRADKLRAVRLVAGYRPLFTLAIVGLSVASAVLGGVGVGFILPIVELARAGSGTGGASGVVMSVFVESYAFLGVPLTIGTAVLGVALVMTVQYGLGFVVSYLRATLQTEYVRDVQTRAFDRALEARVTYFDRNGSDEILNAIVTQADYAGGFIKNGTILLERLLVTVAFTGVALLLAPRLTLLTAVVLGGATVGVRRLFESGYDVGDRVARANERVQRAVQAGTQGIRDVKLFGLDRELFGEFRSAVDEFARANIRLRRNQAAIGQLHQWASAVTVFGLLYLGLVVFTIPLAHLAAFLFAMFRLAPQLSALNNVYYRAEGDLPHVVRTEEFVEALEASAEPDGTVDPPDAVASVAFEDVAFGYGTSDERVLDGVSFSVERGEFVAFVGPSGAGKSTVVSLLTRLYEPDEGAIHADGTPIDSFDLRAWRERLAVVRQQPWVFNDTLRYNLTVGNRDATDAEIDRACEIAQVTEFFEDLPDGYETELGDDGVRLSGGQRQRVAIARALLKDADVLVLDEATSDLDTGLEERVHRAIERMDRDFATVAIAHRLSTVVNADHIHTLEDGRVVESGTHEELVAREGQYATLYAMQTEA